MTIRYIARQVPPDIQESPQWYKEMERLVLVREGRRTEKFQSCDAYDLIEAKLFEWVDDWDSIKNDGEDIYEFLRYEGLRNLTTHGSGSHCWIICYCTNTRQKESP